MEDNFTNHSLRASFASRMYDNNVPEQIIKEITGHRSDCVRVYKRTSEHLRQAASSAVSGDSSAKKPKLENYEESVVKKVKKEVNSTKKGLTYSQMVLNVIRTRNELRKKRMPRFKITAKNLVKRAKKWTIDLNVNMNFQK